MEVTLAAIADYANITVEGKLNILGVFGEIDAPVLPFQLPTMFLALGFTASPIEVGQEKRLEIVFHIDGKEMLRLQQTMLVPPAKRPGGRPYLQSILGLNGISFDRSGDYEFSILVNGEEKKMLPLRVNDPEGM